MSIPFSFRPKLVDTLKNYSAADFIADLTAGFTVGIVALPLAMAFAIASGVKPEAGIFTAVIAGFVISALGGTKVSIGGPTGAFIVILYGIYAKYGAENLAICTIMAGVILFIMGAARLGTMIKFIPYPVTMGFTSGIAVLIFSTQIKDFFGLTVEKMPSEFFDKMRVLAGHAGTFQWPTLALAAGSLRDHFVLAENLAAPRARLDCRAGSRHGGSGAFSSAGGNHRQQVRRHSAGAAASAHSRARPGKTSSICSSPRPPSRCWRRLNRCCAPWWPTA